jgi:hypothetical protein
VIVLFDDINDFIDECWQRPPMEGHPIRLATRRRPIPHHFPMQRVTFVATYIQKPEVVVRLEAVVGVGPINEGDRTLSAEGEALWHDIYKNVDALKERIHIRCARPGVEIARGVFLPRAGGEE